MIVKKKGVDYYSSIEPKNFSDFVKIIRNLEKSYNGNTYEISKKEKIYRDETKKIYFAKKNISKNKTIKSKDLIMLRSNNPKVKPLPIENFIGKKNK